MMEIIDCEQGSQEWLQARLGIPTASMYATVMAKGKGTAPSLTRTTYLYKLLGERITGDPAENYQNHHMERGHEMEVDARNMYAFMNDVDPVLVGFIRNVKTGASPDALIGENGLLEIKTKLPHLLLPHLLSGSVPPEHKAQVHGQIWIAEREWCDFVAYWPNIRPLIIRVYRDDDYIRNMAHEVEMFNEELDALEQKYGALAKLEKPSC